MVDGGCQRHVGPALVQRLAGLADGIERGGAGGIQGKGFTKPQGFCGQMGGIAATETVGW